MNSEMMAKSFWHHDIHNLMSRLLGDSGGVVNSLDFCQASLKPLGCFYFRCILSSQWKAVTVNLRELFYYFIYTPKLHNMYTHIAIISHMLNSVYINVCVNLSLSLSHTRTHTHTQTHTQRHPRSCTLPHTHMHARTHARMHARAYACEQLSGYLSLTHCCYWSAGIMGTIVKNMQLDLPSTPRRASL